MFTHLKNGFVRFTWLKKTREYREYVSLFSDHSCELLDKKKEKKIMAHLFKQMYVDEIDIEVMTVEKFIELVFTEMVYRKMQQLEEATLCKQDETDGNQWARLRKCIEVLDDEERWVRYAERALELLNHDVMWQGIVEGLQDSQVS